MTREEAIHHLYTYSSTNGSGQTTDEQHNEAKRMGIKALEQELTDNDVVLTYDAYHDLIADRAEKLDQESILNKIRAEIETEKLEDSPNFCIKAHNNAVDRVLQILDKYKADRSEE